MKRIYYRMTPIFMAGTLFFTGLPAHASAGSTDLQEYGTEETYFSSRDLSDEIDEENAVTITMDGEVIEAEDEGVVISDSTATITKEGTYILSGTLENGTIIVDAGSEEKVQLVLKDVSMNSDTFAPIYVKQADKVFVTLAEGTENVLTNSGTFTQLDDNNVDAVIFSMDDITLNGSGSLKISSDYAHGIVGKDEVTITNGIYEIDTIDTAVSANDSIAVADGTFHLTSDSDGFHAENKKDDSLGNIYISGGTFDINVGDDAVHANTLLQIDGGTFEITAAEGLEATYITINNGNISISASDDGINAAQKSSQYKPTIEINDGTITVVMGQGDTDGIDANGSIVINGGTVDVTGNSAFDYDESGVINGGTVIINGQQVDTLPTQMGGHGGMGGHGEMGGNGRKGDWRNETNSNQL